MTDTDFEWNERTISFHHMALKIGLPFPKLQATWRLTQNPTVKSLEMREAGIVLCSFLHI